MAATARYKVSSLDVLVPAVQAETRAQLPPNFDIRFAASDDPAEQLDLVSDADFLLVGSAWVTAAMIDRAKRVRLLQKFGVGVDRIDVEAARRAGMAVAIAAGGNSAPVSELALGLMIAVNRRMLFADAKTREGQWLKSQMRSLCLQLDGKTVGLLGFGAIARQTAKRLLGFDTEVIYHSRQRADAQTEQKLRATHVTLDELLARSDVLSIHVPLNDATRHMIDAAAIAKMKPTAIIVNTARGAIIDEAALYDALKANRIRGAGLDVFATEPPDPKSPLFTLDNVVLTPHAGGAVLDNVPRVMGHAFGNMLKFLAGEPLPPQDVVVPRPAT